MQAAKYLNVPPWELVDRPSYWLQWAVICMSAENEHQQKQQDKAQKRANRRGGK